MASLPEMAKNNCARSASSELKRAAERLRGRVMANKRSEKPRAAATCANKSFGEVTMARKKVNQPLQHRNRQRVIFLKGLNHKSPAILFFANAGNSGNGHQREKSAVDSQ